VNDISVALEHVDLLNGLNRLYIELLQRLLQLLVVSGGPGGCPLDLPSWGSLATMHMSTGIPSLIYLRGRGARPVKHVSTEIEPTLHLSQRYVGNRRKVSKLYIPIRADAPSFLRRS